MTYSYSVSQFQSHAQCKTRWQLSSYLGYQPVREEVNSMGLGTLVHKGIAEGLRIWSELQSTDIPHDLASIAITEIALYEVQEQAKANAPLGDAIISIEGIEPANDYVPEWQTQAELACELTELVLTELDLTKNYRVVVVEGQPLIEYKFSVPMGEHLFSGYIDAVLYDVKTGHTEIFDWKTTKSFKDGSAMEYEQQLPLYQYALSQIINSPITAANYYQVNNEGMSEPKINKDGKMSASGCKCTWERWSQAAFDNFFNDPNFVNHVEAIENSNGETEEDLNNYMWGAIEEVYGHMRSKTTYQPFSNIRTFRSPATLERYWQNALVSAADIEKSKTALENGELLPMSLGVFTCSRCQFKKVCSTARGSLSR